MAVGPDFVPWMRQQVGEWADKYGVESRRAFPAWCLNFLFDVEDDDAFNQTDTLTQGDAGLDGWYFDRDGGVFHLVQAKYLDDPSSGQVTGGTLDPLLRAALMLQDPSKVEEGPHRSKLTSIALDLQQALLDEVAVSLDFFVAGSISDQTKSELEQATAALGPNYSAAFHDTERLCSVRLADEPISDLTGETVSFAIAGPHEHFERNSISLSGVEKVAVAAIDGRSLADAASSVGARLFHSNVRYYLRGTNRVNKSMRTTLETADGKPAFWLYNNGITIVADTFEFKSAGDTTVIAIENPQIVNGAQTTSVLKDRRAHLQPGDVSVQARIIAVTKDEDGRKQLEKISEFTNSQSPVRAGDLRSNDRRHKTLQGAFDMLPEPVFYERRRGEWQSLDAASKQRYQSRKVPKEERKVTKEAIGQRYLAFRGKPAESIAKKDSIFGDLEAEAFDTSVSAHTYMLADSLYNQAYDLLKESHQEQLLSLVPGFSSPISSEEGAPTQIETLRRVHKLACAHAVALAHVVLNKRYSNIADHRSAVIRARLADPADGTKDLLWGLVFKSIRLWLSALQDKGALKAILQRGETFTQLRATIQDVMADVDLNAKMAAIPTSPV
ncbi:MULTISPECIES: AIPR family protein [Mycobacteroides]|uniref:AIPR family protein n=1 Tax=Mycobacteroides TaxID=670516 RepID=UPI000C266F9E|nr:MULTISPECIES: AIPR family protein [Mycobacteroides]MBF9328411.1 AIPR family protein [Mycobacteroides chelonae]MBF9422589.1 AIPR family protein [Mycobacteroides chelonae]